MRLSRVYKRILTLIGTLMMKKKRMKVRGCPTAQDPMQPIFLASLNPIAEALKAITEALKALSEEVKSLRTSTATIDELKTAIESIKGQTSAITTLKDDFFNRG